MTNETATFDIRSELARLDRDHAEERELKLAARKIDEGRRLYIERRLLEVRAEREGLCSQNQRPWLQLLAVASGSAAIAAIVSRLIP